MRAARSVLVGIVLTTLLAFLSVGCSGSANSAYVRFRAIDSDRSFAQTFPKAYYSQSDDGDRTVVLIDDGLPRDAGSSLGPVTPLQSTPLRQVVRFKILWNPLHGTRIDAPSTTNCVIDWLIRETGPNPGPDSLRYQGAGFVVAKQTDDGLFIRVRSATLDAATHTGNLADPIGKCVIDSKFLAVRDDTLVNATVARMDELLLTDAR